MNLKTLKQRLFVEWKLKLFAGGAMTILFWCGYFLIQHMATTKSVTRMPELPVEKRIPFVPAAAIIYASQFVTMPSILAFIPSRRQMHECYFGLLLLVSMSFTIFYCWPTAVERNALPSGHFFLYDWIVSADAPGNACPSLHAAFGVFTGLFAGNIFHGSMRRRLILVLIWSWTAVVLISTLLIKQHVIMDLLAGGMLGAVSCKITAAIFSTGTPAIWKSLRNPSP